MHARRGLITLCVETWLSLQDKFYKSKMSSRFPNFGASNAWQMGHNTGECLKCRAYTKRLAETSEFTRMALSRRIEYVMDGWMSQWVSQWVRDVCISHQSDWIYSQQPIKFLVVKVNGMWEDPIPKRFRTAIFFLLQKRRKYSYIGFTCTSTFSVGYKGNLSYKGNLILLFFTKSKFN